MSDLKRSAAIAAMLIYFSFGQYALFSDTTVYSGVNDLTAVFTVPGNRDIHAFTVAIDTNETGIDLLALDYDITHSGTAISVDINPGTDSSYNMNLSSNSDDDSDGVNLKLSWELDTDATKIIKLVLTANPDTILDKGVFSSTYDWTFTVTDSSSNIHTYALTTSAINTTGGALTFPEINVRQGIDDLADGTGSFNFSTTPVGTPSGYVSFTIDNTGSANLSISEVRIDGADAGHFDLDTAGMNPLVTPTTSTTFQVRLDPTSSGCKSATVVIINNDVLEGTYTFSIVGNCAAPAPEIHLKQSLTDIPDGTGSYPFGSTAVGTPTPFVTFTIENNGGANLDIGTPAITAGNIGDFDMDTALTTTSVAAGSTTSFGVRFDPASTGAKSATVSISNNDSDENPYTFTITGTGTPTPVPEVNVKYDSTDIPDNTGSYPFGSTAVGAPTPFVTFTIENIGSAALTVTMPQLTGANALDFNIDTALTTGTVSAGGNTTFKVRFNPQSSGSKTATVQFGNNDSDENPYNFTVTGSTSVAPPSGLRIISGADPIPNETGFRFFGNIPADGDQRVATPATTFSIENTGSVDLSVSAISLTAADVADFDIAAPATPLTLTPGGTRTFTIAFDPLSPGDKGATVMIDSNDSDDNTYTFAVTGNGTPMDKLFFPPTYHLPWESGPFIDGVVGDHPNPAQNDEVGWNNAFRLTYENGTNPQMAFQGLRHNSSSYPYLYLSFEVKNDVTFDDQDLIILTFRPNQNLLSPQEQDLRIFAFPLHTGIGAKDPNASDQTFENNPANRKPDRPPRAIRFYQKQQQADQHWEWVEIADVDQAGFDFAVYSYPEGTSYSWDVEMQIPSTILRGGSPWISLEANFLFFFDVVRVNSSFPPSDTGYAVQYTWPRNLPERPYGELESGYEFPFIFWGDASVNNTGQCKGVWIEPSGVGVLRNPCQSENITAADLSRNFTIGSFNSGTGELESRALNRIVAAVKNNSERVVDDGSGTHTLQAVAAQNLRVRFRLAHWGVTLGEGADWRVLRGLTETAVADPPFPDAPTGCAGSFDFQTFTTNEGWLPLSDVPKAAGDPLTPGQRYFFYDFVLSGDESSGDVQYYRDIQDHQCIYVEIDSPSDTDIITRSIWRNMDFVEASRYRDVARISTRGCGDPPEGRDKHRIVLQTRTKAWIVVDKQKDKTAKGKASGETARWNKLIAAPWILVPNPNPFPNRVADSLLELLVDGYYDTGRYVVIEDKKFYLYEPLGSFGYVAHHDGPVEEWEIALEGAKQVSGRVHTLHIAPDSHLDIHPEILAWEPPKCAVSLHTGTALPLGSFAHSHYPGLNVSAVFEFLFAPSVSVVGMFGFNYFWTRNSTAVNRYIMTLAANPRYHLALRSIFSLYIGAGPELFMVQNQASRIDLCAELGLDLKVSRLLTLEAGTRSHGIFDPNYRFLAVDLGLLFRF